MTSKNDCCVREYTTTRGLSLLIWDFLLFGKVSKDGAIS
ncbi:unnamed protein product, partial [Iphiclides podalirius]